MYACMHASTYTSGREDAIVRTEKRRETCDDDSPPCSRYQCQLIASIVDFHIDDLSVCSVTLLFRHISVYVFLYFIDCIDALSHFINSSNDLIPNYLFTLSNRQKKETDKGTICIAVLTLIVIQQRNVIS